MNLEIMQAALAEMAEDLKAIKEQRKERQKEDETLQQIYLLLEALDKKIDKVRTPTAADMAATERIFKKEADEIKALIESQPKNVWQHKVEEKKIMFFPELWRPENFIAVLNAVLKWVVILIIIFKLFSVIRPHLGA